MNRCRLALSIVLGVTCVVAAGEARAEVAAIAFDGDASAHERELAASSMLVIAGRSGRPFVVHTFTSGELATLKACFTQPEPWRCAGPAVRGKGLQQVALVTLQHGEGPDGTPLLVFAGNVIAANIDSTISHQRHCPRCTDDVLADTAGELARDLLREIATRSGRTVVAIKSVPRGARITFDGKLLGATDLAFNTYPGAHTVDLESDGHHPERRTVQAAEDKTTDVIVTLRRIDGESGPAPGALGGGPGVSVGPRRSRRVPGLIAGAGIVALGTGILMIAIDQDPVTDPDADVSPRYRDSATGGVIIGAAGLVAAGAGGYLWWKYTRSRTAPRIAPTPGGAMIGIATPF